MLKFYEYFPKFEILSTLSTKLSWSHFVELLQIEDKLKREFYVTMCVNECWSVRTLRERINSALFERTAISKMPEKTIINELEKFILEMGSDFAFLGRQKRITIAGEDYYIDLLFYHRKIRRLVVIELKLDKFRPEYKGQVELYLRWLDKYEKSEGEESPIAIILCANKNDMMTELLELDKSGIHVAQYVTKYFSKDILEQKLIKSIEKAKLQLEQKNKL